MTSASGQRGLITSRANQLVRETRELLTAAGRRSQGAFLAEGVKLIRDAMAAGARPTRVWIAPELLGRRPDAGRLLDQLDSRIVIETTASILAGLADTATTQGIVAVFPLPSAAIDADAGHLVLVLDGLQDPGNVGTLLRSALGCGLVRTVVARGGADPFGPKAVRAAAAALFELNVVRPDDDALRRILADRPVWLADANGERAYDAVDWRGPTALVVGSEAAGASPELRALVTGRVAVPLRGRIDSLNVSVAASIIVFEAARQVASSTAK